MAITKAINKQTKSHGAMRNCIEYVLRESKIRDGLVEITGPFPFEGITFDSVYQAYMEEKRIWNKDCGRMYAHHVISFHEAEKITPEQVLEFGREFAERTFGNFQTLIGVHQDKGHLHIHFVTNSVSYMDGHKLHMKKQDLEGMKELTNKMCRDRGLTVAEKGKHFDGTDIEKGQISAWSKDKYNLLKKDEKKSFLTECFTTVMEIVKKCISKEAFIGTMAEKGWKVNWKEQRKNLTFENEKGEKVRDTNLSKTFQVDISKETLEEQFQMNAREQEVEDYYEAVAKEIAVPVKKSGERKSLREKLMESQKRVEQREKQREINKKRWRGPEL